CLRISRALRLPPGKNSITKCGVFWSWLTDTMRMMLGWAICWPTLASWNRKLRCSEFSAFSGSSNFIAKCRLLDTSTHSQTWLDWPVIIRLARRYPLMTSDIGSPVLLEVNVAPELLGRPVHLEAAPGQQLDHARDSWVHQFPRRRVLLRDADHAWVA